MQLLYHCNYGAPLLEEGASIVTPHKTVSPRDPRAEEGFDTFDQCLGPTPGYIEQCYFYELAGNSEGNTSVLLKNAEGNLGSSLHLFTQTNAVLHPLEKHRSNARWICHRTRTRHQLSQRQKR